MRTILDETSKYAGKFQMKNSKLNRETDKPRRKGLRNAGSIQSNKSLPFTTTTETFPITLSNPNKLTSRTRVIFPTRNLTKWSQIVNNGTFAHSISNLLTNTSKNKQLSLKELSPSGQIHFVNMMNRDLTLMQTIELYTALTPHKFTLAYRLKFTVQPNGVYINFSMSQQSNGEMMQSSSNPQSEQLINSSEIVNNTSATVNNTATAASNEINVNNNQQSNSNPSSNQQQSNSATSPQSVIRHGWALFQISREEDSNNSVLPNKIIEVAILM